MNTQPMLIGLVLAALVAWLLGFCAGWLARAWELEAQR